MKKIFFMLLVLMAPVCFSQDCSHGYDWRPRTGVGCVQSDCDSIANAHYSYTGTCVCGSSGSIEENPADPNKECYRPSDYSSCPNCVYACVHLDEECPAQGASNNGSEDYYGDYSSDWSDDWESENGDYYEDYYGDYSPPDYGEPDFPDEINAPLEELTDAYIVKPKSSKTYYGEDEEVSPLEEFSDFISMIFFPEDFENGFGETNSGKNEADYSEIGELGIEAKPFKKSPYAHAGVEFYGEEDEGPFSFPGGKFLQRTQDWIVNGAKKIQDWFQGDLPLRGDDGAWVWKSRYTDPDTGEEVVVKWLGADLQAGWNQGFKIQVYLADVDMPNTNEVNGYTIGVGLSADWQDKFRFGIGIPQTPVSITITPRDIKDTGAQKIEEFIEAIRSIPKSLDIIGNAQEYQKRKMGEQW